MKHGITILIVDDHPVFRRGLREVIEEDGRFQIVGEAADGATALQLILELKPQAAVIDIDMPKLNGLELVRALRKRKLPVVPVFLTLHREAEMFNAAMDLGARAYVLKDNAAADILAALENVACGRVYVSPTIREMQPQRRRQVPPPLARKPQLNCLTPAERRILKLIAEDQTSKEIAASLRISAKTVENHRLNICHKLNLHGSHCLLKFALSSRARL